MQDNSLIGILMWVVGILVSLAVGSGMIDGTLSIPMIPAIVTAVAGWIVVVGAIISVVEGMDYITTIYADLTDDACVNGPTELLDYARSTCGDETFTTINSLAFVPIDEPELVP